MADLANCKYMLFGQEFVESQGKMMARVFEKLLSRHPEQIQAAIEQFSCLSAIDYNQDVQFLGDAPSAFLNKKTFIIAGRTICIGTSLYFTNPLVMSQPARLLSDSSLLPFLLNRSLALV